MKPQRDYKKKAEQMEAILILFIKMHMNNMKRARGAMFLGKEILLVTLMDENWIENTYDRAREISENDLIKKLRKIDIETIFKD